MHKHIYDFNQSVSLDAVSMLNKLEILIE